MSMCRSRTSVHGILSYLVKLFVAASMFYSSILPNPFVSTAFSPSATLQHKASSIDTSAAFSLCYMLLMDRSLLIVSPTINH